MSDDQATDEPTDDQAAEEDSTEDDTAEDETAEEDAAEEESSQEDRSGGGGSQDDRLEEVDEHIRRAREQARETLGEPDEEEFHDSGETPEEDDQATAPPG